ncbi:exopolysaccharide biosynthesis protein [Shewanella aegiceratis]|uniref:exopolysaccharide biosynthesis protein n=1 Tax=Shewanella aegiceratis TaxID=2864203 RepID=UPI0021ABE780|nr:exopolysaccharide biosynthesis protein [Shewanella aegiceratis]
MMTTPAAPSSLAKLKHFLVTGSKMPLNRRRWVYIKTALGALALIWGLVGLFLLLAPPRYVSKWTLILPGAGAGAQVSLDSIGHASSSSSSPYLSSAIDPRENYKALASSEVLLAAAASSLSLAPGELGKPKLKLPNQTGLMEFSLVSRDAESAQQKAWAHYHALQRLLETLREDEISQRENGIKLGIEGFAQKVSLSQQKILAFQSEIGLVSLDQFKELALTIERLRHKRVTMVAKQQGMLASRGQLQAHLVLSPEQAADLLKLKNDQLFQQLLVLYTDATTMLAKFGGQYGNKHPQVVTQRHQQQTLFASLQRRCQHLLGYRDDELMLKLSADDLDSRAQLMQQLLNLSTEVQGLTQEIATLDEQIANWNDRLAHSNDDAAKLEDLHREHQLATAVFTSALAKMDVGKADIYSAYPLVQLLAAPSLPLKQDPMHKLLALIGGALSSLMAIGGLAVLWIRKPIMQRIVTKS